MHSQNDSDYYKALITTLEGYSDPCCAVGIRKPDLSSFKMVIVCQVDECLFFKS